MSTKNNIRLWQAANVERVRKYKYKWKRTEKGKAHIIFSRLQNRLRLNALKNKPCADCFGWFEPCQMDFDHRDPTTKLYEVNELVDSSLRRLMAEIKKCDLLCANCHRLRTHKWRYYDNRSDTAGNTDSDKLQTNTRANEADLQK